MTKRTDIANLLGDCCILDSITHLKSDSERGVVIAASHCGAYSARYALRFEIAALVLHDAGVGKDQAGIAGLALLAEAGMPAAAVSHESARIGDGFDCAERGRVSHCTGKACELGVAVGMPVKDALLCLSDHPVVLPSSQAVGQEARQTVMNPGWSRPIVVTDSASLIGPHDKGAVAVTGSHGGLLGGRPGTAIKADVHAALFNDAGVGVDDAGLSRLPALDVRGIAAATVDAWSARIGDAASTYEDGVISHVNSTAARLGVRRGMTARVFVELVAR